MCLKTFAQFCPLHHLMLVRSLHYQWTKENPIKNPKALLWSRPLGSKHKMYLRRPNTTTHRVIGVHSMCLTPARMRRLCMRSKVTWPVQAITLAPFFVYLLNRVAAFSHWAGLQNLEAKCFFIGLSNISRMKSNFMNCPVCFCCLATLWPCNLNILQKHSLIIHTQELQVCFDWRAEQKIRAPL